MSDDRLTLHPLLLRQLKRSSASNDIDIFNLEENWKNLLLGVSRTYEHFEQDLYLLERSMTISSQELIDLNQKLELAQQIARLGYWRFEKATKQLTWSKAMFSLTGFDSLLGSPKWDQVVAQMQKEDVLKLNALLERAFTEGKEFIIELPFKLKQSGQCIWHYVKGHPEISNIDDDPRQPIQYLSGIVIDITERKKHEQEMEKTHQQLLTLSRQAGMAEVATSILHNIGNILNSANVSITILKEHRVQPYYEKLSQTANLLKTHKDDLNVYLMQDEKGKLIPNYLIKLTEFLAQIHQEHTIEIENINTNIAHIKEIVAMQKTISGTSGIIEKVFIPEVVDLALKMVNETANTQIIKTNKIIEKMPFILADKSKLLQILINLIRNAKDAVKNSSNKDKTIDIIGKNTSNKIQITIKDNGVGISPEQMKHLFLFGFTTKKDGHGFGLHGSALLAKELGGSIKAASPGEGYGADFTLTFPKKHSELP